MLIAHPTDLTGDDSSAFVHASALAAASSARLVIVHGNPASGADRRLPDPTQLATRWGRPITHEARCHECCDDVTDTVIDALDKLHPDLVVLGTHARHGIPAFLHASVGEALARNLAVPALLVQNHGRGFVDAATGRIAITRILIPAGTVREARRGLVAARAFLTLAQVPDAQLEIVHVGDDTAAFEPLGVTITRATGRIETAITDVADRHHACVIVMPTGGHDSLADVLRGSHTEHVIRNAQCPVLSVPERA